MNKRERVFASISGEEPDRPPVGLWMHFPEKAFYGMEAVETHLKFFRETQVDLCKVMNECTYPCEHNIKEASDWKDVKEFERKADFIQKEADIIREVAHRAPDSPIIATVHGVVASASHTLLGIPRYDSIGKFAQLYHFRTKRDSILDGYKRIAQTLCQMVEVFIQAGAEGIYYAALGGERNGFTDDEHREFIAPLDKMVIQEAYRSGAKFVVLHMCKAGVNLNRFTDYPCDVINWGEEESGVSLEEGKKMFNGRTVLGGLNNHHGPLLTGTYEELEKEVHDLIARHGTKGFMLGSDCTLPSGLSYERIAWVKQAAENYEPIMPPV